MTATLIIRMQSNNVNINNTLSTSSTNSKREAETISVSSNSCPVTAHRQSVNRRRRRVCFSTLEVFTFEQILGDNPSVSAGAPLALAPEHSEHQPNIDIGYYEYKRRPRGVNRKVTMESKQAREDYLKSQGYTMAEIEAAANQAASIRRKRERHLPKQWDKFQVAIEKTQKLLRRPLKPAGESATALMRRHQECTRAA
jgi:hypothetical protein